MRQGGMNDSTVTFSPGCTYLVVKDTWNSELSGFPGFYIKQEKRVIAIKGLNDECTRRAD